MGQDSFNEQREKIAKARVVCFDFPLTACESAAQVEASMQQTELDRQELLKVIEARILGITKAQKTDSKQMQGKDGHIRELEEDLRRARFSGFQDLAVRLSIALRLRREFLRWKSKETWHCRRAVHYTSAGFLCATIRLARSLES